MSRSGYQRLYGLYLERDAERDFARDVDAHLANGFAYFSPTSAVLARPVPSGLSETECSDLWRQWDLEDCDCWFVWAAVGWAWEMVHIMPFDLPRISWVHRGRLVEHDSAILPRLHALRLDTLYRNHEYSNA